MSYAPLLTEQALNQRNHSSQNHSTLPASRRSSAAPSKRTGGARIPNGPANALPIIVHCHLCWDWVWQRPQQFISRLSRRHKILFVETLGPDPQLATPVARFRALEDFPNITVVRLQFPSWRWGDGKYVDAERRRIVKELLAGPLAGQFERPIQWFYDPMAVAAFAGEMDEALTVYDCMDELSKFKGAPPEIMRREAELLSRADVVFT
ncbi:MAG TPA: glycosyltransferase family 1 protein, partial [Verrucomicrobiae bacterium]|nr:glycosyltransferase family 1 protein [Verrucomicrobiae bacterium]